MRSLDESVKKYGVLTPIVIKEHNDNKYILIDGHDRLLACQEDIIKCSIIGYSGIYEIPKSKIIRRR